MTARDSCLVRPLQTTMTVSLRLLPVIAGALSLLPFAVPGVVPVSFARHNSPDSSRHRTESNVIDTGKDSPLSRQGSMLTSGQLPLSYLERIKERILSKMQLSEEPRFNQPLKNLPDVIREGFSGLISPQQPPSTQAPPTLEKASILVATSGNSCRGRRGSLCLHFTLDDTTLQDVGTTTLWFWKARDQRRSSNNFIVNEVKSHGHRTLLANESMSETIDEWVKMDLSNAALRWAHEERQEVELRVWCRTCTHHALRSQVADHTPFIVIAATETHNHQRRSIERECSGENENRCCREAIHINVTEMGWEDWFIHPTTFTFYYCHGSCPVVPVTGRAYNGSEYNQMKQGLMLREEELAPKDELEPCCSPTSYYPMSIVYASGSRYKVRHILDLQVRSCGCRD